MVRKKELGDEKNGECGRDDDLEREEALEVESMHRDSILHLLRLCFLSQRLPLHFGLCYFFIFFIFEKKKK
jgi:hypothetical protein